MSADRRPPTRFVVLMIALVGLLPLTAAGQTDGALDPTFDGDGVYGAFADYVVRDAATLPDQGTAVVGDLAIAPEPLVDWLKVSTTPTLTECGAGIFSLASFEGRAVLVDRGGNVVVGGVATFSGVPTQEVALIARFPAASPCGGFDTGWSATGWEMLDSESFCDDEDCLVVDLAESPTATPKLYALVESRVNFLVSRFFVVAFLANGNIDTAFGSNGYTEVTDVDEGGSLAAGRSRLAVDAQGHPSVLGTRFDPDQGFDADVFLIRFDTLGNLWRYDEDELWTQDSADEYAAALELGADGQLILGVDQDRQHPVGFAQPLGRCCFLTTGDLVGIAVQGDGKYLPLYDSLDSDALEVWRITARSMTWDPEFGGNGRVTSDVGAALFSGSGQDCVAIVLSAGRPLLACNRHLSGGDRSFFVRLRNRYLFADGFEVGSKARWRSTP